MRIEVVTMVLVTLLCVQVRTHYIQGSYLSINTDSKTSSKHYTNPRRYLLEFLKSLQKSVNRETNIAEEGNIKSVFSVFKQRGRTRDNEGGTDKRGRGDFGIMPPMREMCRLLRLRYCRGHS